jgi:hypothetical protein
MGGGADGAHMAATGIAAAPVDTETVALATADSPASASEAAATNDGVGDGGDYGDLPPTAAGPPSLAQRATAFVGAVSAVVLVPVLAILRVVAAELEVLLTKIGETSVWHYVKIINLVTTRTTTLTTTTTNEPGESK